MPTPHAPSRSATNTAAARIQEWNALSWDELSDVMNAQPFDPTTVDGRRAQIRVVASEPDVPEQPSDA